MSQKYLNKAGDSAADDIASESNTVRGLQAQTS